MDKLIWRYLEGGSVVEVREDSRGHQYKRHLPGPATLRRWFAESSHAKRGESFEDWIGRAPVGMVASFD